MAHNEELAHKVRQELINANAEDISERKMFGGLAFMVNDKMCICISGSDSKQIMVRVGKDLYNEAVKRKGASPTIMKENPIKGYVDLDEVGQNDLHDWVELALKFNSELIRK